MPYDTFVQRLESLFPSPNLFYALRITGRFGRVQARSVPKQHNYRPLSEAILAAGHRDQHVLHRPPGVLPEGPGDDGLAHVVERQIETIEVADLLWHVAANESRALSIHLRERLDELDELD